MATWTSRFVDAFTEASDTNLSAHTPTGSGVGWTQILGASESVVDGPTDTLVQPYFGGSVPRAYTADISGAWTSDQRCEGTDTRQPTASGQGRSPSVRLQGDGASSIDNYNMGYNAGVGAHRVHRMDSGSLTALETIFGGAQSDLAGLSAEGSAIDAWVAGVQVGSGSTDSTYTGGDNGVTMSKSYTSNGMQDYEAFDSPVAGVANPKGPLGHPLHGALGGPIG